MLRIIVIICVSLSFTSCMTNPSGYLKRSANNKLIDVNGFEGSKRRPIYNEKYIKKAKRNVINNDYEDELPEDDELIEPAIYNRMLYKKMVDQERKERLRLKAKERAYSPPQDDEDIDLYEANQRFNKNQRSSQKSRSELEIEIAQIKAMLKETREEIVKSKCPYITQDTNKAPTAQTHVQPESLKQLSKKSANVTMPAKKKVILPPAKTGTMTSVD